MKQVIFLFPVWMPFFLLSASTVAGTSTPVVNSSGEGGLLVLFLM